MRRFTKLNPGCAGICTVVGLAAIFPSLLDAQQLLPKTITLQSNGNSNWTYVLPRAEGGVFLSTTEALHFSDGEQVWQIASDSARLCGPGPGDSLLIISAGNRLETMNSGFPYSRRHIATLPDVPMHLTSNHSGVFVVLPDSSVRALSWTGKHLWQLNSQNLREAEVLDAEIFDSCLVLATDRGIARVDLESGKVIGWLDELSGLRDNLCLAVATSGNAAVSVSQMGYVTVINQKFEIERIFSLRKNLNSALPVGQAQWVILSGDTAFYYRILPAIVSPIGQHPINKTFQPERAAIDKFGAIWMVSGSPKVHLIQPFIKHFIFPINQPIQALAVSDTTIYAATGREVFAVNRFNGTQNPMKLSVSTRWVSCLATAPNGLICGTFDDGIYHLNGSKIRQYLSEDGLSNNNILSLFSTDSVFYAGTFSGVTRGDFSPATREYEVAPVLDRDVFGHGYVYHVSAHSSGLLFATDGAGVLRYTPNAQVSHVSLPDESPSEIYAVIGLADEVIYADNTGQTWMAPGNGKPGHRLRGINGTGTVALIAVNNAAIAWRDSSLYLLNTAQTAWSKLPIQISVSEAQQTAITATGGSVWIGTNTGVLAIDTGNLAELVHPVLPVLINSTVGTGQNHLEPIELKYNDNTHRFQFALPQPAGVSQPAIRYRLLPDTTWQTAAGGDIYLRNLVPANYTLQVASSQSDSPVYALPFQIIPPWYATWWFRLAAALLLLGLILAGIRLRYKQITRREESQRQALSTELARLRQQVNPHFLFNNLNALHALIPPDSIKAREYLRNLSQFYRNALDTRQSDVVLLRDELSHVQAYLHLLKLRFGESLQINEDIEHRALEAVLPPFTLQLLIENAVKHNEVRTGETLTLELFTKNNQFHVANSRHVPAHAQTPEGTGLGLANIRQRYQTLFDRKISVFESDSKFEVVLPLIFLSNQ